MALIASDAMTGTNWTDLHNHIAEQGGQWVRNPATPSARMYIYGGKVHCGQISGSAGAAFYLPVVPDSADYTVACDYTVLTNIGHVGIAGRMSTTANTYYFTYYDPVGHLILAKRVNGVITTLGFDIGTMSAGGATYELALIMAGTTISVEVDGVEVISEIDSSITAVGRGGVRSGSVNDASTGKHIDNFTITDASVAPSPRSFVVGQSGL